MNSKSIHFEDFSVDQLIEDLRAIEGVKSVKRESGPVLKIELFSREIPGSEAEKISGDLRKISQKVRNLLDGASSEGVFTGWEWIVKPEKKYQETSLGKRKISDRKAKGHEPAYYRVSIDS